MRPVRCVTYVSGPLTAILPFLRFQDSLSENHLANHWALPIWLHSWL
jgi:hypothetical protein